MNSIPLTSTTSIDEMTPMAVDGEDDSPPQPAGLWRELLAVPELALFPVAAVTAAISTPSAESRPVLVIPGFIGTDQSTLPLRIFLWSQGHQPYGWGIGRNIGPADHVVSGLDRMLVRLHNRHQQPIDIVGWSLGGVFGRMLALNRPEMVRQVITLGSPIRIDRRQSNVSFLFDLMGSIWKFAFVSQRLDVDRIPVPSTTVWTRHDGVVPGISCRQTPEPRAEAVQVRGSHFGLGHNGAVLRIVADRLALPDDEWRPFEVTSVTRALYPSNEGG
ncbi:MAG: alpha/beta hydrolase [Acidimicrobiia bacterium]|nr:alpha/beta hydrolase [Acidimicrobiia bacterium]